MNKTRQGSREKRVEKIAAFCMDNFPEELCYEGGHGGSCGVKGWDFYFLRSETLYGICMLMGIIQ